MLCPFCAEDIKKDAFVCKHCHRDLQASRPLMDANAALTKEVAELRQTLARLQDGELPGAPRGTSTTLGAALRAAAFFAFAYFIIPIALLVAAHWVLIVRLDANPIYLRLISLLIPLPFGYALYASERQGIWTALVTGTVIAAAAVSGMLTVVGILDGRPIVPSDRREWQESAEYATGIMLAFVTGNLLGRLGDRLQARTRPAAAGAPVGGAGLGGDDGLARIFRWDMIITALGAIATAGVSMVAALKGDAE